MRRLVDATEIAVNADYGSGFAADGHELTNNMRMAIDTGVAALSICDQIAGKLIPQPQAVARIQACRQAIDISGVDVVLVARTHVPLIGRENLNSAIARLVALSRTGADVLCLSGLRNTDVIKAVVLAVAPKSLDIQLREPGMTSIQLGQLGVRRISMGDVFAETAWANFERVAAEFIDYGGLAPECRPLHDGSIQ